MQFNRNLIAGVAVVALAGGVAGTALARSDAPAQDPAVVQEADDREDDAEGEDVAISDQSALEKASDAALAHLADKGLDGRVTETEEGDEESYYEVEVTLDDGREVDVQLDRQFNVVGDEHDGSEDDD